MAQENRIGRLLPIWPTARVEEVRHKPERPQGRAPAPKPGPRRRPAEGGDEESSHIDTYA